MVATVFPDTLLATETKLPAQGPILIATDGSDASDGAFAVAARLASQRGADVSVLAVLESMPVFGHDIAVPTWAKEMNATRHDALALRAKAQMRSNAALGWSLDIREGPPAIEIAKAAREHDVSLVVLGIGDHALRDRLFGDETALQVLRLSDTPVLAVTPEFDALPHRVILATDFSEASIRAFRTALPLISETATVYLAHVVPRFAALDGVWDSTQPAFAESLGAEFLYLRAALNIPLTMTVETMILRGDPSRELLDLAKASKADLIVCGTHGQGFISRMLLGSVATTLVRGAPCPMLVVPQPRATPVDRRAGDRRAPNGATRTIELPKSEWPTRLKTFTERNAGRHCRIEVDDPAIGSQAQAFDYPLRGVAFDRRDERLEIMLGDSEGALHLTRGIAGVTSVSLVVDEHGRDRLLRISYADGQTLLFVELWGIGDKSSVVRG
jgi:nucleotide-binding universal stress UspA family protein